MNKNDLTAENMEWIEWAKKKADWYDRIVAREDEYLGQREHSRLYDDKNLIRSKRNSVYGW